MTIFKIVFIIVLFAFVQPAISDSKPANSTKNQSCKELEDKIKVLEDKLRAVSEHQDKMGNMFAVPTENVKKRAKLLIEYAKKGNALEIRNILASGQNPNLRDDNGASPLMYASGNGHIDAVKVLLEYKANTRLSDKQQRTALKIAQDNGHQEVIKLLKEKEE